MLRWRCCIRSRSHPTRLRFSHGTGLVDAHPPVCLALQLMGLVWRLVITAAAVWLTATFLPGIVVEDGVSDLVLAAFVFGVVNAFILPVLRLLTREITLVKLGVLTLAVNAFMVLVTAALVESPSLRGPVSEQVLTGILITVIVSAVSVLLSWYLPDPIT